jgi:hypothetical protein
VNPVKKFRRLSFWMITGYLGIPVSVLLWVFQEQIPELYRTWIWAPVLGGTLAVGWGVWIFLGLTAGSVFRTPAPASEPDPAPGGRSRDFTEQRLEQDRRLRLYLHPLHLLQREGRLLDFLNEDLSHYTDDQIGAAVRSIQEDCKKAVRKYMDPRPVLDQAEGDAITIAPGFDPDSILLVGNVTGTPPFEGILQHRGWRAGKKEIPRLTDVRDPAVIMPAEVRIP